MRIGYAAAAAAMVFTSGAASAAVTVSSAVIFAQSRSLKQIISPTPSITLRDEQAVTESLSGPGELTAAVSTRVSDSNTVSRVFQEAGFRSNSSSSFLEYEIFTGVDVQPLTTTPDPTSRYWGSTYAEGRVDLTSTRGYSLLLNSSSPGLFRVEMCQSGACSEFILENANTYFRIESSDPLSFTFKGRGECGNTGGLYLPICFTAFNHDAAQASRGSFRGSAFIQLSAVPEPASWAMMISGFGLIGAAARRRARVKVAFG